MVSMVLANILGKSSSAVPTIKTHILRKGHADPRFRLHFTDEKSNSKGILIDRARVEPQVGRIEEREQLSLSHETSYPPPLIFAGIKPCGIVCTRMQNHNRLGFRHLQH